MKLLPTITLLFLGLFSFGQEVKDKPESEFDRVMTYTEFWDEILSCKDTIYFLDNTLIKWTYIETQKVSDRFLDTIIIKPKLELTNLEFRGGGNLFQFKNMKFNRHVAFNWSVNAGFVFIDNCVFENGLELIYQRGNYISTLTNCVINKTFWMGHVGNNNDEENSPERQFSFKNCTINVLEDLYISPTSSTAINIENTNINSNSEQIALIIDHDFLSLYMDSCNIDINLKLDNLQIYKSVNIKYSNFLNISISNFIYPSETNFNFKWVHLKDKLSIIQSKMIEAGPEFPEGFNLIHDSYRGESNEELSQVYMYDNLTAIYNKLFQIYKSRGDIESSNGCYIEMKDLETRRRKYLYEIEGGTKNYLNYKINTFLKFFAEYGTSPVRSIQISGWVILIFAFFYFFFYSDWDKINRKFLMQQSNKLIIYFKSEQKLEELYSDKHKEDLSTFIQFKQNLKDSKTEVPFFFMVFLKPLYWVAVIKHKFNVFLYKRVEFLQGTWSNLTAGKKFFLGTLTFLSIITYGLYLIFVRSLNSLILSINTFTTLGFGDIPVVGISRYVAILEGFLGWFLLSIFSVSLISQILQN